MKRRKFIHGVLAAGLTVFVGAARRANRIMPRRFTWAGKSGKYPGGLRAPDDIFRQSKWGG